MLKVPSPASPPLTIREKVLQRLDVFAYILLKTNEIASKAKLEELVEIINTSKIDYWLQTHINAAGLGHLIQLLIRLVTNHRSLASQHETKAFPETLYRAYTYCIYTILQELAHIPNFQEKLEQVTSVTTLYKREELESIKDELEFVVKLIKLNNFTVLKSYTDITENVCYFFYEETSQKNFHPDFDLFRHITSEGLILQQIQCLRRHAREYIHSGVNPTPIIVDALALIDEDLEITAATPSKSLELDLSMSNGHKKTAPAGINLLIGKILGENIRNITLSYSAQSLDADSLLPLQQYAASIISCILIYTPIRSITVTNIVIKPFSQLLTQFIRHNKSITTFQIEGRATTQEVQTILAENRQRQQAQELEKSYFARVKDLCLQEDRFSLEDIYDILRTQDFPPVTFCMAWALRGPDSNLKPVFQANLDLARKQDDSVLNHYYQALIKRAEELIRDKKITLSDVYQYLAAMNLDSSDPHCIDELYCAAWVEKKKDFPDDNTESREFLLHLYQAADKLIKRASDLAAKKDSANLDNCVDSFQNLSGYFCAYPSLTSKFAFVKLLPLARNPSHPFHNVAQQTLRRLVSAIGKLGESPEQKLYRHARLIIVDENVKLDDDHKISDWIKTYIRDCSGTELPDTIQTLADIRAQFPEHYLKLQMAVFKEKKRLMNVDDGIATTRLEILETVAVLKKRTKLDIVKTLQQVLEEDPSTIALVHQEITDITKLPMFYILRHAVQQAALDGANSANDATSAKHAQALAEKSVADINIAVAKFRDFIKREELELNSAPLTSENAKGECLLTTLAANCEWEFLARLVESTGLQIDLESGLFSNILKKYYSEHTNLNSKSAHNAFRILISQAPAPDSKTTTAKNELPVVVYNESPLVVCLLKIGCEEIFTMLVEKGLNPNVGMNPGGRGTPILLFAMNDEKFRTHVYILLEKSPVHVEIFPDVIFGTNLTANNDPRLLSGLIKHGFNPTSISQPGPRYWKIAPDSFAAAHQAACAAWNHLHPRVEALENENARLRRELAELKQRNSPGLFKPNASETPAPTDGAPTPVSEGQPSSLEH